MRGLGESVVLIPVKAFHQAKGRLAGALDAAGREDLARAMATTVVHAAHDLPVAVVCDDVAVAAWAEALGVEVLWQPGVGLNGAVGEGVATLAGRGVAQVLVAHADLPHATDLRPLLHVGGPPDGHLGGTPPREPSAAAGRDEVVLVPDRRRDGTNVIVLPAGCGFRFAYGAGSFRRHRDEAARVGLTARVVEDRELGWDVDVPADLAVPGWAGAAARGTGP